MNERLALRSKGKMTENYPLSLCTNPSAPVKYFPAGMSLQNLHLADTFVSLSVFLSAFISLFSPAPCLTCYHLISPPHFVFYVHWSLQVFLFYLPSCSPLDRWLFVCLRCLSPFVSLSQTLTYLCVLLRGFLPRR